MTAQQAADAAIEDGKRPDLVPLPESAFDAPIARYRAYAVRQARALERAAAALRRARPRAPRAAAGSSATRAARRAARLGATAFDRWLLVGAAYGALGDLDAQHHRRAGPRSSATRSTRAPPARSPPARARLPAAVRKRRARAGRLRDPRPRDPRGRPARPDGRRRRRARHRRRRRRDAHRDRHAARRARRAAATCCSTVDARLTQLEATLDGIRREHGAWPAPGALPRGRARAAAGELGAALEALAGVPGALETRSRRRSRCCDEVSAAPSWPPRPLATLGAVGLGGGDGARARAADAAPTAVPFDGPHQAGVITPGRRRGDVRGARRDRARPRPARRRRWRR